MQFRSRIAWKLVWCPPNFDSFVLVDDDGLLLAGPATPQGPGLPDGQQRMQNFMLVRGSKYSKAAEKAGAQA